MSAQALTLPVPSSIDDFSRRYGLGITTCYKLIKEGALVARKVGRRTIILPEDERAWLDPLPKVGAR